MNPAHSSRLATPQTLSKMNSYRPKLVPSMFGHCLISTSWCSLGCVYTVCSGLHGNCFAHVSTQMDNILQAARHIVWDRLHVDSMFSSQDWKDGCPPPRGNPSHDLNRPCWQTLSLISWNTFFVVVPFREKIFLWHLKLVFPQSNTELIQKRYVLC